MYILNKTSQHNNDFTAILQCEHCDSTQRLTSGYNDSNYYNKVIPAIRCNSCGKKGKPITPEPTVLKPYFATFGGQSPLRNNYVGILATSNTKAHETMYGLFDRLWGFIYPADDGKLTQQIKAYNLESLFFLQYDSYKVIKISNNTYWSKVND